MDRLKTIVMASRKGGAGKTTLTCHLAVEAERVGAGPVCVIDIDEMAGLALWWDARLAPTPILVRAEPTLAAALDQLREIGVMLVFIDTPPALSNEIAGTLSLADLVLIPVRPSPDDLRAVGSTVSLVQRSRKPMAFVINCVKPRVRLTAETAIQLSQHGPVAQPFIWDRTDYAAAKTDGRTAPELDSESKSADEIAALWTYVARRLELTDV